MKAFKKLATLSMALLMALGVSAFAGCKKGGNTDTSSPSTETSSTTSEEKTYTCYEFVVLNADGTKVGEGYQVQVCEVKENGELGLCKNPLPVVNGVCVYTNVTEKGVYEAHLMYNYEVVDGVSVRTSADAFGEYTLTLAK